MTATQIQTLGTFYVPSYEVRVGATAATELVRDIIEVRFSTDVLELDSFDVTLNNWDAQRQTFKYEPASLPELEDLFLAEHLVEVKMGYAGALKFMIRGRITAIEPNYPQSGAPTLSIRGQNYLHQLRRYKHSHSWHGMKDSDIAMELGRTMVTEKDPGLGVRVLIDEKARAEENPEQVSMQNEFDIDFLARRAEFRGYVFYLEYDDEGKERFYFGPSDRPDRPQYALEWGKSLISFRPTFATAHQFQKVIVRGVDRTTGEKVEATAIAGRDCKLNEDLKLPKTGTKVITDPPARSAAEARRHACETLHQLRRNIIVAKGSTIGLPDLRAGSYVRITLGRGSRFNGRYFVTSATHSIGSGGYTTDFEVRREEIN